MNRWSIASQFLSEPEPTPWPCFNKLALGHVIHVTLDLQHSIFIPLLAQGGTGDKNSHGCASESSLWDSVFPSAKMEIIVQKVAAG